LVVSFLRPCEISQERWFDMHVEYEMNGRALGRVELDVAPDILLQASRRKPGVVAYGNDDGDLCDYFAGVINEGDFREGEIDPEEEGFEQFAAPVKWRVVGNEREACLMAMGYWLMIWNGELDPTVEGKDLPDDRFSSEESRLTYERDRACWSFYIEDLSVALEEAREMVRDDFSDAAAFKP
jgi:hypothetical protein